MARKQIRYENGRLKYGRQWVEISEDGIRGLVEGIEEYTMYMGGCNFQLADGTTVILSHSEVLLSQWGPDDMVLRQLRIDFRFGGDKGLMPCEVHRLLKSFLNPALDEVGDFPTPPPIHRRW